MPLFMSGTSGTPGMSAATPLQARGRPVARRCCPCCYCQALSLPHMQPHARKKACQHFTAMPAPHKWGCWLLLLLFGTAAACLLPHRLVLFPGLLLLLLGSNTHLRMILTVSVNPS